MQLIADGELVARPAAGDGRGHEATLQTPSAEVTLAR